MIDRIEPVGFAEGEGIKINLYGKSGSGKTTLWATFPKPILAIVCSGGNKAGELRSIDTPEYRKTIKQVKVHSREEIKELCEYQEQTGIYNTVVLDHATGLQDMVLKAILGLDELPPQNSWGMARQQDWGQCALHMKESLRYLLELDCNVVIVAQERFFNTDADSDSEFLMPYVASALSPSVTGWLNPAVDYICQTFLRQKYVEKQIKMGKTTTTQRVKTKGIEYCLRTGPDEVFTTKFRVPRGRPLPPSIVDPTYDKIMDLIHGRTE